MNNITPKTTQPLSGKALKTWRLVQLLIWLVGVAILFSLLFYPVFGIHAFWNVLIPVAPALFVLAPGLWRNVCPLASTSLFPRHMGFSKSKMLSLTLQGRFYLFGLAALFIFVPFRHVLMDTNGPATAAVIILLAVVAVISGMIFDWKSGWCSSLCPVHPVEKFYGLKSSIPLLNAHCNYCRECITPCSDSTPGFHPLKEKKTISHRLAGILLIGGFPGFIWGWFQVQDYYGVSGWQNLPTIYGIPFIGLAVTLSIYIFLYLVLPKEQETKIITVFAFSAVACYYWYRIPALFGFGIIPGDGMLVDLSDVLPLWFPLASRIFTTAFFGWFLIVRGYTTMSWVKRPPYIKKKALTTGAV